MTTATTAIEETATNGSLDNAENVEKMQFLTFMVGDEYYAIDILKVREIRGWNTPTQIPNAPKYIRGVINLRGLIVPILDMRRRFKMSEIEFTPQTVVIVIYISGRTIGIVVDNVSDVVDISTEEIRPAPDFGNAIESNFIMGLATIHEHMAILLNVDEIFLSSELKTIDDIAEIEGA